MILVFCCFFVFFILLRVFHNLPRYISNHISLFLSLCLLKEHTFCSVDVSVLFADNIYVMFIEYVLQVFNFSLVLFCYKMNSKLLAKRLKFALKIMPMPNKNTCLALYIFFNEFPPQFFSRPLRFTGETHHLSTKFSDYLLDASLI